MTSAPSGDAARAPHGPKGGAWEGWRVYGFAMLFTAATLAVRLAFASFFPDKVFTSLFLVPIVLSAFLGGWGPGLLATALSALAVDYFLIPPVHTLGLAKGAAGVQYAFFVVNGLLVCALTGVLHRSRSRLAAAARDFEAMVAAGEASRHVLAASEAARERSDGLYQALLENSPAGCLILDGTGRVQVVNDAYCLRSGYSREELLAMSIRELSPSFGQEDWEAQRNRIVGRCQDRYETRHRAKDGTLWPVEVVVSHSDGRFFGFLQDITDRLQAMEDLRAAGEFNRAVLDSVDAHLAVLDPQGRILAVNAPWRNFARENGPVPGEPVPGTAVGDDYLEACRRAMATHEPGAREAHDGILAVLRGDLPKFTLDYACHGQEQQRWFILAATPLGTASGGAVVAHLDVTARRKAELALAAAEGEHRRLEAQLVQMQKLESVGRLAGGVAHDFNNMLGVILGQAEVALLTPGSRPFHPFLTEIVKAARRSGDLTRQLLAFARKQTVTPKVLDLNETIQGMLKMLGRLIGEDITLAWSRKEGLWPVKMDPSQLDQILANLAVNARDAIAGVGVLTIGLDNVTVGEDLLREYAWATAGEFAVLTVADSGTGMEAEVLEHIFEPFFTTKTPGQGTGLGLATVLGIVQQNGGFLIVQTAPGEGTTFRIFLPRHRGGEGEASGREAVPALPVGRGQTILLVEDEPSVLASTRLLLEHLGYAVVPAHGSGEALACAQSFKGAFALLITDVVMPDMNGRELSERILALRPGLPVLFMSGYTADILAPHGVLGGGTRFLQKPASLVDLANGVDAILGGDCR